MYWWFSIKSHWWCQLASIHDASENEAVVDALEYYYANHHLTNAVYIGGQRIDRTDNTNASDGGSTYWEWSDGSPFGFTDWRTSTSEPNNNGDNPEDVIQIAMLSDGTPDQWNDAYSGLSHAALYQFNSLTPIIPEILYYTSGLKSLADLSNIKIN